MTNLNDIVIYLDQLLQPALIKDYCPNGLQVEGKQSVQRLITGVSACQSLLDAAVQVKADAVLVHHGYFWKYESSSIVGIKRHRVATLLNHDISLLAYHLPLDTHVKYGNNIQLAEILGFKLKKQFELGGYQNLGALGILKQEMPGEALSQHIQQQLGREPLYIAGHSDVIKSIAWCTGGAQNYLMDAAELGIDAYLTGEASEHTIHVARELGIHFYAAGHHATERYGVKALGNHLAQKFKLEHQFIDIDNPV